MKEMRTRIRQQRSSAVLSYFLVFITSLAFLMYLSLIMTNRVDPNPDIRRTLGKIVFLSITLAQLLAIYFIAPLYAADSISSERADNTFDLLKISAPSARAIIRGKLLAAEAFSFLLLVMSLPLQLSAFFIGGLTPLEYLACILLLVTTTNFLCSTGIWASSRCQSSSSAIGLAYAFSGIFIIGLPLLMFTLIQLSLLPVDQGPINLLKSLTSGVDPIFQPVLHVLIWILVSSNPVSAATASYSLYLEEGARIWYNLEPNHQIPFSFLAPWIAYIVMILFIAWLFTQLAIRRIQQKNNI